MLSPSDIVVKAAGLSLPKGEAATSNGRCAMCGKVHHIGDGVFPFEPETSFTDIASLSDPTSRYTCTACVAIWNGEIMRAVGRTVINSEGVFPANKSMHIAYWLLNPPKPPFLFMLSDQQLQHLAWRTPVNYSQKIFQIRFGSKLLTIRRDRLTDAVASCNTLCAAASVGRKGAALKSPFMSLTRDLDSVRHGKFNPNVLKAVASNPELSVHIDRINQLSPGEMWALSTVLYAVPERPDALMAEPS